jgi:hypothetical protein
MSTATQTTAASAPSLVSSAAFRTFVVVFAIAAPAIYMICEMKNWPLFTYHPGTDRVDLFYAASRKDEGPAMHWYGWTANTLIGAAIFGFLATMLPENVTRRIPLALTWIVPLVCVPILIYGLKFYWRWE